MGALTADAPAKAPPRVKARSLWWVVHSWAGLKLSIFMTFVLATGTLAVFAHELDWMATPAMRVAPQSAEKASLGDIAAAARAEVPGGRLQSVYMPTDPWFAAEVWVDAGGKRIERVYVNPWTAEVTGTGGWANIHRVLRQTHRHLMLPVKYGVPIVCSMSFLLLASLVTGLVTYKKFWRGFLRNPHWRGGARRLSGDLHRLGGLWSLWFLVLMILTGLWYLVEVLGGQAPPHPQPPKIEAPLPAPAGPELDALVARAQAAYPTLRINEVRFPAANGARGLVVSGQADALLVRDRSNAVWLDPDSGAVRMVSRGEDLGVHQRISEMADPLHFGTFGGLVTKVIWFVFGVFLTGLSITGVMIYSLRLKGAYAEGRGPWARAFRGMGVWIYPAIALILLSLALTPAGLAG
ncbi:PepSY-associated TM helix domain-containing protein [Phenylobacterium sp. SCN 70-31]|uniref:PepSY-associated TM helix domain-containing protein n=1 Tax=Phenylobacterium sp. SCN 70-31 TaxID=1660129 RepID=UPI00086CC441|nr:PepSY-associated TM helix domain-containing protein [Phenylobacterium sp. SCN 70-31]ODT85286.1 MAG: peptidase [Phenylobacterium sp. SCN 70-31]